MRGWIKRWLIHFLKILHLSVVIFVVFGWASPVHSILIIHLWVVPLMVVQWLFNDGTCILTNVENAISGQKKARSEQQGQFIKKLLSVCFTTLPDDAVIKKGLYTLLVVSWSLSAMRVFS